MKFLYTIDLQIFIFCIIIFFVSFFSDIVLNILSSIENKNNILYSKIITSLKPYFREKSMIYAGGLAGLTVLFAFILLLFLSKIVLGYYIPDIKNHTFIDFTKFLSLALILGYIIDIGIEKFDIFGSGLHDYYKIAGSGLWGALSFVFAIIITYFIIFIGVNNVFTL